MHQSVTQIIALSFGRGLVEHTSSLQPFVVGSTDTLKITVPNAHSTAATSFSRFYMR